MDINEKKQIVRADLTQVGVPALFDDILAASEIDPETRRVTVTENGVYMITPDSSDDSSDDGYDGLSAVEVTVDVPSTDIITSFEDPIEFDSIEAAEELNRYDVKGALLSYNSVTGKYTAWNGGADLDARAWNYRANHRQYTGTTIGEYSLCLDSGNLFAYDGWHGNVGYENNEYGEVIAVCVGDGLWVSTKWDSSLNRKWCKQNGSLWDWQNDCFGMSGAECTAALMAQVTSEDETLFYTLKNFGADDHTQGHWYVPSKYEIFPAIINQGAIIGGPVVDSDYNIDEEHVTYDFTTALAHACHLRSDYYWSSSQLTDYSDTAYLLNRANRLEDNCKRDEYPCVVLLRFGAALVADGE